jgi:multidrug transporter EmrE-like cation transporter
MTTIMLSTILLTVTFSAIAQLALKSGVSNPAVTEAMGGSPAEIAMAMLLSPLIWVGLIIYGVSVIVWLWVLTKVELSVAYPFVGVSFVLTMVFSYFLLGENVGITRMIGTLLIAAGCVLVAKTA